MLRAVRIRFWVDSKQFSYIVWPFQTMDERLLKLLNNSEQNYPHALEYHFPRVFEKIMALWDSSDFDTYLADLMTTTRSGRQGFPREVASDIIYLCMLHDRLSQPMKTNSWAQVLREDQV
jgi:hypothetical protein